MSHIIMNRIGLGIKMNIGMLQLQYICVYKSHFFLYNLNITFFSQQI